MRFTSSLILLSFLNIFLSAQQSNVIIDSVSVDLLTGHIMIGWHPVIYDTTRNYYWCKGDYGVNPDHPACFEDNLLDISDTLYIDTTVNANIAYEMYRVGSSTPRIVYGNYHKTILLQSDPDLCRSSIRLTWEAYYGWEGYITYRIYDFDDKTLLGTTTSTTFLINDFEPNHQYNFFVRAVSEDGKTSSSNLTSFNTLEIGIPEYITPGNATANENEFEFSFNIDPNSKFQKYILYRAGNENMENKELLGTFENLSDFEFKYVDSDFNPEQNYYYQLEAIDGCGNTVFFSDTIKNIVLHISNDEEMISLDWSEGDLWNQFSARYQIYRELDSRIFETNEKKYTDEVNILIGEGLSNKICYSVKVTDQNNQYTNSSVKKCIEIFPEIFIPESFTPDGDEINDYLIPEFEFIPSEYKFVIIDRRGKVVFESKNPEESWDGENGPQGTYVYRLNFKKPNGKKYTKTGYVNLVRKNPN